MADSDTDDSTAHDRLADKGQQAKEIRRRQSRRNSHLKSEVSSDEVEEHINFLQNVYGAFKDFDDQDVQVIAQALSTMRFASGQTIVEKGETGTWFGILIKGSMRIPLPGFKIMLGPGSILGEMAIYEANSVRSATVEGEVAQLHAQALDCRLCRASLAIFLCRSRS